MIIKIHLLFVFCLAISGCSHIHEPVATAVPETQQNNQSVQPTTVDPALDSSQEQNSDESSNVVATDTDIYSRIRQGFRFTNLSSRQALLYQQSYEEWSVAHPRYLHDLFTRAGPYLYYILDEIEKRGLPTEIALLPAIESAYKPNARSSSKAVGLWQFIPSTGAHFGLTQDWWYDGRRDTIAATQAALDYITQLNAQFNGDWFLTLAAYNAGPGTIRRAIKRNAKQGKATDYQNLELRQETARYVPKLFALKNILIKHENDSITLPVIMDKPYFEIIDLPGQVNLNEFANQTNININELRNLNAGFLRWASSPNGPHRLLLPLSDSATSTQIHAYLTNVPIIQYQQHRIAHGETLSDLAQRYAVGVEALKTANHLVNSNIRAGKDLFIPMSVSNKNEVINIGSKQNINNLNPNKRIHQVSKGDTLWSIAHRYKVKVDQLMHWNQLAVDQILQLNQTLFVFNP